MPVSLPSSTTAMQPHLERHCAQNEGTLVVLLPT
jgi:hypothetical protein